MSVQDLWFKETLVPSTTYRPVEGAIVEHTVFNYEPATPFLYQTRTPPPLAGSLYKLEMERDTCVEWRVIQNSKVLEVSRMLLGHERDAMELPSGGDSTQATTPVRFRFPSAILPNIYWYEDVANRRLYCLVLLVTGTIVRLSFSAPLLFQIASLDAADICIYRMQSITGECAPVIMAGIDATTMVVACTDGSLFTIQLPRHQYQQRSVNANGFITQGVMEAAFNPESLLAKMLVVPARMLSHALKRSNSLSNNALEDTDGMLVYEAASTPEQVISLTTYTFEHDTFIFGICRDNYLRAWSLAKRKCIWTRPLQQHDPNPMENHRVASMTAPSLLPEQPRKCIWTLRHSASTISDNSAAFHLLTYVPNDREQVFTILRGQLDQSGHLDELIKVYTHPSPWITSVNNGGNDVFGLLDVACEYLNPAIGHRETEHVVRLWTLWQRQQQQIEMRFTFLTLSSMAGTAYKLRYTSTRQDDQEMTESTMVTTTIQNESKSYLSDYRALYGERWFAVATDASDLFDLTQLNSMVEAQPEAVSQLYLQHIFFPNRFSHAIIEKALDCYESQANTDRTMIPSSQNRFMNEALLVERVTNAISRRLTLPVYEPTGAVLLDEFSEMVKKEWYRFLTMCSQFREVTRQPMSLFVDSSMGIMCIVRKRALSFLRRCSEPELLWHHVDEQYDLAALSFLPSSVFTAHFPSLSRQNGREDMASLLEAMITLQEDMGEDTLRYVEEELRVMLITAINEPLDTAGYDIYDVVRDKLSHHGQYRLFGLLRGCNNLSEAIHQLLDVIRGHAPSTMDILPLQRASRLVESTVVVALAQRISITYQLAIRLVLLVLISLLDSELRSLPRLSPTLVTQCVQAVRYTTMLKRICDVSSASQVNSVTATTGNATTALLHRKSTDTTSKSSRSSTLLKEDDFIRYFTKLQVSDNGHGNGAGSGGALHVTDHHQYYSIIHQLIHTFYTVQVQSASLADTITMGAEHIQLQLPGSNNETKVNMLEDENELEGAKLAAHLLALDLTHISYQSLQLLLPTPIVCHLRGSIHLRHDEYEKAKDNFIKAGIQLESPEPEMHSSLALFNSILVEPSNVTALFGVDSAAVAAAMSSSATNSAINGYYTYVAGLFEKQSHYEYASDFYQLALKFHLTSSNNKVQSLTAQLYSQLFKCYLALHQYDDAFAAMMQNPDPVKQNTCLSQFVIKLCDGQHIGKLCSYAFGGLQSEVEATLEFRARTCGVLATPNYYRVLYAYHVHRGNFRQAARAMYNNAQGLGKVMPSTFHVDVIANQARSYLAAINALHLVDGTHAWILVDDTNDAGMLGMDDDMNDDDMMNDMHDGDDRTKSHTSTRKRRRVRVQDDHGNKHSVTTNTIMIDMDDMKREYGLALARLQLIRSYPEMAKTMWVIKPSDAVNLFNQRGQYGHAFALSKVFSLDLSPIFVSMVRKCVRLAQEDLEGKPAAYNVQDRVFDISTDSDDASYTDSMEGPPSARAWRLLEQLLNRYDSHDTQYQYRALVLEETLKLNRYAKLPAWLTYFYTIHNPEDLIRIYLKYNLIEDAAKQALLQIEKEISASNTKPLVTSLHWLPYSLLDTLVKTLEDTVGHVSSLSSGKPLNGSDELYLSMLGESESTLSQLHRTLSSKLNEYFNLLKDEGQQQQQLVQVNL
ncbi:nucleoporin Nup120/160-domain-containing protein [Syncephalis plumigaleata]|nr:nucleoporin Nup120/160-domain-containing protein [Syncephalis plumigaleata]